MQQEMPQCFYRISAKALILDDDKKFLLTKENNGKWELPGGGLDFYETPQNCLVREIKEEMGLYVTFVSNNPSYFLTSQKDDGCWIANIIYIVNVKDFNFTASDECIEIKFFNKKEALNENLFSNVVDFIALYNENNH